MSVPDERRPARVTVLILLVSLVIGVGIGLLAGPERQQLSEVSSGDAELAQRVRTAAGDGAGLRSVVVAEVTSTSVRWAGLGNADTGRRPGVAPTDQTIYELGSVTKTFTGALFADAVKRREVRPEDTLEKHLPEIRGTAAGKVTLASLAQHRSGLPRLGATAEAAVFSAMLNENPYATSSTERLISDAASAPVTPDQPPTYSNFGVSLLGTALVRAAGASDYPALVAERVTGPLGMSRTTIAGAADEIPEAAIQGFTTNGQPTPCWTGTGYLPSGSSTFITIGDLAVWAQAQLTGRAPGIKALEPTANLDDQTRIGWTWLSTPGPGGSTDTWHNGGTAGFRSMLILDREGGRAVVMMGNSDVALDSIATSLLHDTQPPAAEQSATARGLTLVPIALALFFGLVALRRAIRGTAVLPVVSALLTAVFGLLLLWNSGPWAVVGGWLWGIALAPVLAAAAILAARARTLPFRPDRRVWLAWLELVIGVAVVGLGVALW